MAALGSRERSGRLEASPRDPYEFSENHCKEGLGTVPWRLHSLLSAHQALLFQNINTKKGKKTTISVFMYKVYYCVSQTLHCSTALPDDFNRTMEIEKEKGRISGSKILENMP